MADYYNVTTNLGDAEIAAAIASNTKLAITHIAFGDGNGSVPTPQKTRTTLVREVHRQAVTKYERHPTNANWIIIETIIPSHIGGFWVREMGVIANGKLISHGSHAPFEKVADSTGVSEYRLKFTLNVRDGNVVNITLDQSLIYASQAWVEENYVKRINIRKNFGETYAPVAAKNYDFNNIMPGDYIFFDPSTNALNAPPFAYASVYCEGTLSNSDQRFVIARDYFTGQISTRGRQNGDWSDWNVHALKTDNVASASKLQTARNIAISGDGTGSTNFDGTSNTAVNFTLNNVNNSAGVWGANNLEIPTFTLNNKGLITSAGNRQFPIATEFQYGATKIYAGFDSYSNDHAATANTVRHLNEAKPERNQVKNEFGRITCPLVSNGYDYNNIMPGDYLFHDAGVGTLNAPPFAYASIYCEATYADNGQRFVTAREYGTGKLAVRGRQNTSWSEWLLIATTASDITGNAASASKIQTVRTVQFSGAATGSFGYDGSGNSSCILTLANSGVAASTYGSNLKIPVITVNQKGLLTGVSEQLIPIIDDLSTGGSNKLLSAEQGKNLDLKKLNKTEIRKVFGDTYAAVVPAGYDYNNIMPGDYVFHDASQVTLNAPPFAYASVFCEGTLSHSDQRIVIAREYFSGQIATKARQNGTWSDWNVHALKTDNVASASKLQTARNIALSGAILGHADFDGSGNISISVNPNTDNLRVVNGSGYSITYDDSRRIAIIQMTLWNNESLPLKTLYETDISNRHQIYSLPITLKKRISADIQLSEEGTATVYNGEACEWHRYVMHDGYRGNNATSKIFVRFKRWSGNSDEPVTAVATIVGIF